ncbi:MAG: response regulator transcription factor [Firmicutes bacterium]|nr:response regulator transcription factor [Bacillota bacterium]
MSVKILAVDDDLNICQLINLYLTKEGYLVDIANDGEEALAKIAETTYDVILLDVMMPNMDGLETLKNIREQKIKTPVIFLTAKGEAIDRITGLDLGADDYITKPPEWQEVISRVKAILRRLASDEEKRVVIANLDVCISSYIVKVDGVPLEMTPKEIDLLFFLATNPHKVFTREQLLNTVWGKDNKDVSKSDVRTIDVHVKRIREKLGENHTWKLATVWSVGYKFVINPS